MKGEPRSLVFLAMAAYLFANCKKEVYFNVRRVNSSQDWLEANAIGLVN